MDAKPALTIVAGASYVKVQKNKKEKKKADTDEMEKKEMKQNNKRGSVISTFSRQARNNMFQTMMRIRRGCLPCFVTLTYPKVYSSDAKSWKRDLHSFTLRLNRMFPDVCGIWKLEPQKRGAPHYHLLIWGVPLEELKAFVPFAWHDLVGNGDVDHLCWHLGACGNGNIHCVQEVITQKAMYQYVMKYIDKSTIEGWKNVGKWWGIFFRSRLPFGEEVVFDITEENAIQIMRYIRRFTGRRALNHESRIVCCDADHWMEKLQTVSTGSYREWLERVDNLCFE